MLQQGFDDALILNDKNPSYLPTLMNLQNNLVDHSEKRKMSEGSDQKSKKLKEESIL